MIWGTPVTATQFFGYGVALSGLVYYKLGGEQLKQHIAGARRTWAEFGNKKPALRHAVTLGLVVFLLLVLLGGLAPSFAGKTTGWLREILGGSKLSS
jgi:hypothetical protein